MGNGRWAMANGQWQMGDGKGVNEQMGDGKGVNEQMGNGERTNRLINKTAMAHGQMAQRQWHMRCGQTQNAQ